MTIFLIKLRNKKIVKIINKCLTVKNLHAIILGQLIDGPVAQLVRAHP